MIIEVTDSQVASALDAGEDASVKSHVAIADLCKLVRILAHSLRSARAENAGLAARIAELERKP